MEGIGKERRCDEELARGCGAEEQQSTVEGAPLQPQPPFFNEINGSHFIALPKQHLVSSKRSSFKRVLVERQHIHIRTLAAEACGLTLERGATSGPGFCALAIRPNSLSARVRNEAADLLRPGEDHVGAVSHHTGSHQGRRALLRTIVADIGLEAQVAFPEIAYLPVRGGDLIAVT